MSAPVPPPTGEEHLRRLLRVGHKGAALLAPGNTLAAFDAALEAGVDMIEFDVLSERRDGSGDLFVAHDYEALASSCEPLGLTAALEHLGRPEFSGIELDVDLKLPAYGARVVAALREAGLERRSLISCTYMRELDVLRRFAPQMRLGWSIPRARRDYTSNPFTALPAAALLTGLKAWLPGRARSALRAGRFDAIMAHWRLVGEALVSAVHQGGGSLYAWTVDDAAAIARLCAMGVDGVITNDPRLFEAALATSSSAV